MCSVGVASRQRLAPRLAATTAANRSRAARRRCVHGACVLGTASRVCATVTPRQPWRHRRRRPTRWAASFATTASLGVHWRAPAATAAARRPGPSGTAGPCSGANGFRCTWAASARRVNAAATTTTTTTNNGAAQCLHTDSVCCRRRGGCVRITATAVRCASLLRRPSAALGVHGGPAACVSRARCGCSGTRMLLRGHGAVSMPIIHVLWRLPCRHLSRRHRRRVRAALWPRPAHPAPCRCLVGQPMRGARVRVRCGAASSASAPLATPLRQAEIVRHD